LYNFAVTFLAPQKIPMSKLRILYAASEINPFLQTSEVADFIRRIPQVMQERGMEIRILVPRFGTINERKNRLHEVVRLSGINISVGDEEKPLVIKVASIPNAKLQVYFIDNDDYFKRKTTVEDDKGGFHEDNDERAMFFCHGVLETVKKLGWQPDVIHCHGWLTGIMALYIKHVYNKDPHFKDTKVVYSFYNDAFTTPWNERFYEKLKHDNMPNEVVEKLKDTSFLNITKVITENCDGVNIAVENLSPDLQAIFDAAECMKLDYISEEHQAKELSAFFDKVIEANVLA
jgi:starch synthase